MVTIFVEGKTKTAKGELREALRKLISKHIGWQWEKHTKIIPCGGIQETIGDFHREKDSEKKFLLIDLDAAEELRHNKLNELNLAAYKDSVFFMIQEMEAWFFSQPEILKEHFLGCTLQFPDKLPKEIRKPSGELKGMTNNCSQGQYHKISDGVALLKKLDPQKLVIDFPEDFGRLIEQLQAIK